MNAANTDQTLGPPAMTSGAPLAVAKPSMEGYVSQKTKGWQKRLIAYLSECAKSPFRPGKLDCALFFARGVQAETGVDIYSGWPEYKTLKEGLSNMQARGFKDHAEYVASLYPEWESPLMGQQGDCAVVEDMNGSPALGIIQGANIYVMGLKGIGLVPLTYAKRAFYI